MIVLHGTCSIGERIDRAVQLALDGGRTPTAIALGKDDYPAFQAWILQSDPALDEAIYRGLRVRGLQDVFLSRLELRTAPGAPNAILL